MLTGQGTRRKKRQQEEAQPPSNRPPDTITDPLAEKETDALRLEEMREDITDAMYTIDAIEDEEIIAAHQEDGADLDAEEIEEVAEADSLGDMLNELAKGGALDAEDPLIEAFIDAELEQGEDESETGFGFHAVRHDEVIDNELQSEQRPFKDTDTLMPVKKMSWIQNNVKTPLGRIATQEPLVERGLSGDIKRDVSTRDEDDDLSTRTRERFVPELPSTQEAQKAMKETVDPTSVNHLLPIIQSYHQVMQSNPDLAKTFILGQIRQINKWLKFEGERAELPKGDNPVEWVLDELLPAIVSDMGTLEGFFDEDHDLIYYRQWLSEVLRVERIADHMVENQDVEREQMEADAAMADLLDSIPEGELVGWSLENQLEALELYNDEEQSDAYTERLQRELFLDQNVRAYLDQVDAAAAASAAFEAARGGSAEASPDQEDAPVADEGYSNLDRDQMNDAENPASFIYEAMHDMDMSRLMDLHALPEMQEYGDLIQNSAEALARLPAEMKGVLKSLSSQYGVEGGALQDAVLSDPVPLVMTVCHRQTEGVIPEIAPQPNFAFQKPHPLPEGVTDEEEEDEEEDEDESPGEAPESDPEDEGAGSDVDPAEGKKASEEKSEKKGKKKKA